MTTRKLIEAVREPVPWTEGGGAEVMLLRDYDAMRAATLAVLDDLLTHSHNHCDPILFASVAGCPACTAEDNARYLREKLR